MAARSIRRPRTPDDWLLQLATVEQLLDRLGEHTLQLHRPLKRDLSRLLDAVPRDTLRTAFLRVAVRLALLPWATGDLLRVLTEAGPQFKETESEAWLRRQLRELEKHS